VVPKLKNAGHILDLGMRAFEPIVDGHGLDVREMPTGATLPPGKPPYETNMFGSGSQNFA